MPFNYFYSNLGVGAGNNVDEAMSSSKKVFTNSSFRVSLIFFLLTVLWSTTWTPHLLIIMKIDCSEYTLYN